MYHADTWKDKTKLLLKILWPILITQVGLNAMNLADTMMSGRVSSEDLVGVGIGSSIWMPIITGLNGILLAVTPIVSQLIGAGKRGEVAKSVSQALYVSVIIALIVAAVGLAAFRPILDAMQLESKVQHIAYNYLLALLIGIVPLFASNVLRYFFDAQGFTRISMFITLIAVPFNVLLNFGFIFGKMGFPALGGVGAGYATAITYWLMFAVSAAVAFRHAALRQYRLFREWALPSWKAWKELLAVGIPIGLGIFFEVGIFSIVTIFVGNLFDTEMTAAHQIALNFSSLVFMIPLSISMALTIVIGFSVGGEKWKHARQYTLLGVCGGVGLMGFIAILLYFFREPIASLYTEETDVAVLAAQFLVFAIFYQLSDAAQASLLGVLRGYKDVRQPFIIAFVSYWIIGVPSGYLLAARTNLEAFGFWVGIIIGLTCAAVGFLIRLLAVQRRIRSGNTAVLPTADKQPV
ncbi:MATE family efflux transporter [Paenibacillus nanensis]|uniref:Probable multidrug resistance protein NorM n=1 Tax=Paenibacillus nanensis TaxID=393251 RepID=A0A3A1VHK1_9BACL|nr:MATE family efflux transporter [Paenibacillus nanensis]RIX60399.1 MATE family efflux transporter [Paenibacillus nanensis]